MTSGLVAARYRVTLAPELGAALRLLNLFAQIGLLPDSVAIAAHADGLLLSVHQSELSLHRAELIAARMRSQVDVTSVTVQITLAAASDGDVRIPFSGEDERHGC